MLIFPCWPHNYYCLFVSSCFTFFVHTQNSHFLVCYCFQSQLSRFGRNQTISEEKVDHFQLRFETSKLQQTWNNKYNRHRLIWSLWVITDYFKQMLTRSEWTIYVHRYIRYKRVINGLSGLDKFEYTNWLIKLYMNPLCDAYCNNTKTDNWTNIFSILIRDAVNEA